MNERIKLLADQASHQSPDGYPVTIPYSKDFVQKFAELIVRECIDAVLNNDIEKQDDFEPNSPFFAGWERGVIDSCQVIKQHFGVEE